MRFAPPPGETLNETSRHIKWTGTQGVVSNVVKRSHVTCLPQQTTLGCLGGRTCRWDHGSSTHFGHLFACQQCISIGLVVLAWAHRKVDTHGAKVWCWAPTLPGPSTHQQIGLPHPALHHPGEDWEPIQSLDPPGNREKNQVAQLPGVQEGTPTKAIGESWDLIPWCNSVDGSPKHPVHLVAVCLHRDDPGWLV